jgi:5-formyltetrahydrofolate cyclo-ligase
MEDSQKITGQGGTFHPSGVACGAGSFFCVVSIPFEPMSHTTEDPRAAKAALRERMRGLRRTLDTPEAGEGLRANVLTAVIERLPDGIGPVGGYWPIGSEPDVRPLLRLVAERGGTAALPSSGPKGTPLVFRRWEPGAAMREGRFGIAEPGEEQPIVIPAVLLVPLLAFDRRGHRLGYGAGYYDRTLGGLRRRGRVIAVGVAFAGLEVASVPRDRHDQRLDWIVTEREALRFTGEGIG